MTVWMNNDMNMMNDCLKLGACNLGHRTITKIVLDELAVLQNRTLNTDLLTGQQCDVWSKGSLSDVVVLVLPVRGCAEVGSCEAEVPVVGGRQVAPPLRGADGQAGGLAQLQMEALRGLRVALDRLAVCVPVLAVLSWNWNYILTTK